MKILRLSILASFLFFTSCSKDQGSPKNNDNSKSLKNKKSISNNQSNNNLSKNSSYLSGEGPLGKFPKDTVISTWLPGGGGIRQDWETDEDNRWTRVIKDELNVSFKYLWKARQDFDTKIQASIASGDIPEYISKLNYSLWYEMASRGMFADVTDSYKKFASPLLRSSVEYYGNTFVKMLSIKDKMYGISVPVDGMYQMYMAWIRKDWLDRLKIEKPKNTQELFDLIYKFKNDDPDGDGQDNSIGLALNNIKSLFSGQATMAPFFEMYHSYPENWIEKDGKIIWGGLDNTTIQPLKKLAKMYADGVISSDFYTYDDWDTGATLIKPKAGIVFAPAWFPDGRGPETYKADGAVWVPFELRNVDDDKKINQVLNIRSNFVNSMRKDTKYPEFAVKLNNLIMQKTQSDYIFVKDPDTGRTREDMNFGDYGGNYPIYIDPAPKQIKEVLKSKDDSKITSPKTKEFYNQILAYLDGDMSFIGTWGSRGPGGGFEIGNKLFTEEKTYILDAYRGPQTKTMRKYMGSIKSKRTEIYINIITGQQTPEEGLAELKEFWKANGGDDIEKEVNEWAKNNQ